MTVKFEPNKVMRAAYWRIKHKDVFHMKNLYIMMYEWLVEQGWSERDEEFPEISYLQNEAAQGGTELWIFWRCEKDPFKGRAPHGYSKFFKWRIRVDFHVILLKDIEVMHQGQKYKTNSGEVEMKIWAEQHLDPEGDWDKHPFLRNWINIFRGRLLKEEAETLKLELYREAYRLQDAVKTYLKLKRWYPEPEEMGMFFPVGGVGEA